MSKKNKTEYDLEGKNWTKYKKLDRDLYFGYHSSDTIESILEDRKKRRLASQAVKIGLLEKRGL